jgi:hypothetical protein
MKPTDITSAPRQHKLAASLSACLLSAALLVGCGPGVVGTGSEVQVSVAPASTSSTAGVATDLLICTSPLSTVLGCSLDVNFRLSATWSNASNDSSSATAYATLNNGSITLVVPCEGGAPGLRFTGQWTALNDGTHAYWGTYTDPSHPDPQTSVLRVSLASSGSGWDVTLVLQDTQGGQVASPWSMRRTTQLTVASCGS